MAQAGTPVSNAALATPTRPRSFARLAIAALVFIVILVLFGSVVRITNSGAGCGQHWPTCQGEITHLPRKLETFIEYGHRISAALGGLVVLWLTVRAFLERTPRRVRVAAVVVNLMMLLEFYIGRSLVRSGLVGQDASVARAVVMPLHLVSTCVLTAALALIIWWSLPRAAAPAPPARAIQGLTLAAGVVALLISMTGAVTALGDTVRPVLSGGLASRLLEAESSGVHFLDRVRGVHPVVAVLGALLMFSVANRAARVENSSASRALGRALALITALQVVAGCLNVFLRAPGWLQVTHLLLANLLWLTLVGLWAEARDPRTAR
jgi:cytochrome c oxidase assembly protein subunit 15